MEHFQKTGNQINIVCVNPGRKAPDFLFRSKQRHNSSESYHRDKGLSHRSIVMEYFESKVRYFYDVLGCFGEVSADYLCYGFTPFLSFLSELQPKTSTEMKQNYLKAACSLMAATALAFVSCNNMEEPAMDQSAPETRAATIDNFARVVYVEVNDVNPLNAGEYTLSNGAPLIVSGGLGDSRDLLPRINNTPELTVIDIT